MAGLSPAVAGHEMWSDIAPRPTSTGGGNPAGHFPVRIPARCTGKVSRSWRSERGRAFRLRSRQWDGERILAGELNRWARVPARYPAVSGPQRSTKTSMIPPQTPRLSMEMSSVRSTRTVRGCPSLITSRAARITSASPHPPPTVPTWSPVGCISILAPTSRGTDPFTIVMVAMATVVPSSTSCWSFGYSDPVIGHLVSNVD